MSPEDGAPEGRVDKDVREERGERDRAGIESRFFTLDEVATYLNVSVTQAYSLVRSGDLPAIKLGGRGVWRVDKGQLEAYVDRLHEETRDWAKAHPLNPRERG